MLFGRRAIAGTLVWPFAVQGIGKLPSEHVAAVPVDDTPLNVARSFFGIRSDKFEWPDSQVNDVSKGDRR